MLHPRRIACGSFLIHRPCSVPSCITKVFPYIHSFPFRAYINMRITSLVTSAAFLGSVSALVPRAFSVPSDNGFPDPDAEQELVIAKKAGGKLPGAPLPTELGPGSTTAFQLIAFNELFETAFFSSLLKNISSKAKGYEITQGGIADAEQVISVVLAVCSLPFT